SFRYPPTSRPRSYAYGPPYNAWPQGYPHLPNQSFPARPPAYNASSNPAPYVPWHHYQRYPSAGDTYSGSPRRYGPISCGNYSIYTIIHAFRIHLSYV